MKTTLIPFAFMSMAFATPAFAQAPADPAIVRLPATAKLAVTTGGWKDGGDIPFEHTQYRTNTFPGLTWSKGPAATKSYAIVMQDTDLVIRGGPVLHWTMFNIPASVTRLPPGMAPEAKQEGSAYGQNYRGGNQPYLGPRTPPGPKHHYHMQVFALDTTLPAEASTSFQTMMDSMKDHVLASGVVVGLGQADPAAPPPAPRPATAPAPKQ